MLFFNRPNATILTVVLALSFSMACGQSNNSNPDAESDQYFTDGADFAGSHILIAYDGSANAATSITRTKEEALAKAKELTAKLKSNPATFADVAKAESDGPSAPNGGSLGSWQKGRMVPEFDNAIEKLEVGEITDEPVETQFGYHIIIRESAAVKYYAAYGIIISYAGIPQSPIQATRTKEQADSLAKSLAGQINGSNFDEMAAQYNDVFDKPVFLGAFTESPNLPEGLLETVQGLKYGEVGGPIEFPVGYTFVKRVKAERLGGSHILISYAGAERAAETTTRTKEEAETLANALAEEVAADPSRFDELAATNSDDPSGQAGGSLGVWFRGSMVPVFDSTIATLDIGAISSAIESEFGFHIVRRDSVPQ